MPRRGERAKMIEADRVDVGQQGEHPVYPPAVAFRAKRIPVVDRIAPALSADGEVVGRDAGDDSRPELPVEEEQFRVSPHVARVRRDEKWQIADETHPFGAGMGFQTCTLTEHKELCEPRLLDLGRQIPS